jgi:hypothetical protein
LDQQTQENEMKAKSTTFSFKQPWPAPKLPSGANAIMMIEARNEHGDRGQGRYA